MKVESRNIAGLKTVVYYRWNKFFPEINSDYIDLAGLQKQFYKDYSSTEVFYVTENTMSDYLDFAEYEFKFDPEKKKGGSRVITNLFSSDTIELASQTKKDTLEKKSVVELDYLKINHLNDFMFPQTSPSTGEEESNHEKYIGKISKDSFDILFLKIPSEERVFTEGAYDQAKSKPGIWKVEIYNDYIDTNNNYTYQETEDGEDIRIPFIESSVLDKFEEIMGYKTERPTPGIVITFGPEINDVSNSEFNERDYSEYFYWNSSDDAFSYKEALKDTIISRDWVELCREISSAKLLKIVITPDNTIESINYSRIAWDLSKNPNRKQDEYSLSNSMFISSRESNTILSKNTQNLASNVVYDPRSGVVLGSKNLGQVDIYGSGKNIRVPFLDKKVKSLKNKYHIRKSYSEGESVCYNDGLYISLTPGNIGECPLYSTNWLYALKYEDTYTSTGISHRDFYLKNKVNSLNLLKSKLSSGNSYYSIEVNDKTLGNVEPYGNVVLVSNDDNPELVLKIFPNPGAEIVMSSDTIQSGSGETMNVPEILLDDEVLSSGSSGRISNVSLGDNITDLIVNIKNDPADSGLRKKIMVQFKALDEGIELDPTILYYSSLYDPDKGSENVINPDIVFDYKVDNKMVKIVIKKSKNEIEEINLAVRAGYYEESDEEKKFISLPIVELSNKILFSTSNIREKDIYLDVYGYGGTTYELTRLFKQLPTIVNGRFELLKEDFNLVNKTVDPILVAKYDGSNLVSLRVGLGLTIKEHECKVIFYDNFSISSVGTYLPDGKDYKFDLYPELDNNWKVKITPVFFNTEFPQPIIIDYKTDTGVLIKVKDKLTGLDSIEGINGSSIQTEIILTKSLDYYTLNLLKVQASFNISLIYED